MMEKHLVRHTFDQHSNVTILFAQECSVNSIDGLFRELPGSSVC